jgi:hypothetical protein
MELLLLLRTVEHRIREVAGSIKLLKGSVAHGDIRIVGFQVDMVACHYN